ncbi:MAG: hypothetical protein ABIG32_00040 [Candidatus Uhrbacteria bacterium]
MSKKLFVITVCATLVLAGWGCAPKSPAQQVQQAAETIADAIAAGKSVKCEISSTDGTDTMDSIYWIKGDDMRADITINGETSTVVQVDNKVYTQASMFGESDCDWLVTELDEEEEGSNDVLGEDYQDFDYEMYENNEMYAMQCDRQSFGKEKFEVDGKVCNIEDIFGGMMQ